MSRHESKKTNSACYKKPPKKTLNSTKPFCWRVFFLQSVQPSQETPKYMTLKEHNRCVEPISVNIKTHSGRRHCTLHCRADVEINRAAFQRCQQTKPEEKLFLYSTSHCPGVSFDSYYPASCIQLGFGDT